MAAISALLLTFMPIGSGGDIPQNLVFLTSRPTYFHVVLAVSILSLSPGLVLWARFCAVLSMAAATAWIASGMERVATYADLPPAPTREQYLAVVFDPNFLAFSSRVAEAMAITLSTGIAALAVHRACNVVRNQAAEEERRSRVQQLLGRYVPQQVAEQLIDGGQLAPRLREASVLVREFEGHRLRLRVGVATGSVAAGTVGDAKRQTYTIYGDTVNLAQRLERLNKDFETDTLICGATFIGANGAAPNAERMGTVQVRGRELAVKVFALRGA